MNLICDCRKNRHFISIGQTTEEVELYVCLHCGKVHIGDYDFRKYQEKYLKNEKENNTNDKEC